MRIAQVTLIKWMGKLKMQQSKYVEEIKEEVDGLVVRSAEWMSKVEVIPDEPEDEIALYAIRDEYVKFSEAFHEMKQVVGACCRDYKVPKRTPFEPADHPQQRGCH